MMRFWCVAALSLGLTTLAGCSPDQSAREPTSARPITTIPADFPLDAGWPPDSSKGKREIPTGAVGLDLCDIQPWKVPKPVASRRLVLNIDQRYRTRTLVLYRDSEEAAAMVDAVERELDTCAKTMSEVGTWLYGEVRRTNEGIQTRRWFDESAFGETPNCYSMDLYRKGNGVLVSSDSGVGTGKNCAEATGATDAQEVVAAWEALHVFNRDQDASPKQAATVKVIGEPMGFSTDNGNIGCHIDPDSVRCDIGQRDWDAPAIPSSCAWDWGNAITLDGNGKARFVCAGDTALNSENPLLPGQTIQSSHVSCHVQFNSVRCARRGSQHGFYMDRATYKLF